MAQEQNSTQPLKKNSLVFFTVFFLCLAVLMGLMYYMPKFRQLFFDVPNLRPSAEENGQISGNVFADVEGNHPHALAITYLKSKGVIKGYDDGSFKPDELITRGEVMKLVVGALHIYPHHVSYRHCFNDVGDEWFAPFVCYSKERGWVSGSEDNKFYPGRNITGAEFLKIVIHAYKVIGLEDQKEGAPWFEEYVNLAEEKGWINSFGGASGFDPMAELTRAELAELLFIIMQTEQLA